MNWLLRIFPANDFALFAVILGLPLAGAFVNGVFGKRLGKDAVRLMALAVMGGAFAASVASFAALMSLPVVEGSVPKLSWLAWRWMDLSSRSGGVLPIDVAFNADAMSSTMMLVVTGVGFLIHLYSSEYMKNDPGYYRFFAYLNLFIFSMLTLIMADNLPVLFVGWEGVGLCSYLLIGFWFGESKNASAGKKAFIANRIGDFGLLCAMAILLYYCGTLTFSGIKSNASASLLVDVKIWPLGNLPTEQEWAKLYADKSVMPTWLANLFLPETAYQVKASTLVALSLFLGCAGKSAQMPLYVWLPDAMAGPTPVSALIHAATMVTAGVYLVARMCDVFVLSPFAMAVVAIVGVFTALFAASMGLLQRDLKKVLAYSTVSQLGFMFIGVGTGAFTAGFFHVFTHAFFKACLCLGAGSVIHAMHTRIHDTDQSQDMANMGGLRRFMPITHATFLVSCLSIAGLPFVTAGFYSKDEILWKAYINRVTGPSVTHSPLWAWPDWLGPTIYWAGIVGATMTSFYMFRAYFKTFHGEFRGWSIVADWKKAKRGAKLVGPEPHESPWQMTAPLAILGALAVFSGFLGAEPLHVAPLIHRLEPIFANATRLVGSAVEPHSGMMWVMMIPGALACFGGIGLAYFVYVLRDGAPEAAFAQSFPRLHGLIYDKWRVDEFYELTVLGMVDALADIFTAADRWIVDGILAKLSAFVVRTLGSAARLFQTGRIQVYSAGVVVGLGLVGWHFVQPNADVVVDDSRVRSTGRVVLRAREGLGYQYKWSSPDRSTEFSRSSEFETSLKEGTSQTITLTVRNAFGRELESAVPVTRAAAPRVPGLRPPPNLPAEPSEGPIKIDGSQLPGLIRGEPVK